MLKVRLHRSKHQYSTGVGTGGPGGLAPPLGKMGGQHPIWPPTFHGSPLSALPSVYQFISCHTLYSTALALVCVRGHFRILEMKHFTHRVRGNPSHTLPNLVAPLPCICGPQLLNMLLRLCIVLIPVLIKVLPSSKYSSYGIALPGH